MPILIDYHLHTNYTVDANATLFEMAESASQIGISEIGITDHYVVHKERYKIKPLEIEKHFRDRAIAKQKWGIDIKIGLEMDFFEEHFSELQKIINTFDFDFILGANHFIKDFGLADEAQSNLYFQGRNKRDVLEHYFENLAKTIESNLFDIIAHIDIFRKFGEKFLGKIVFDEYKDLAEQTANLLLKTDTGIELNCRGFEHPPSYNPYPCPEFLMFLKEKGIKKITLGSDAHSTDKIGFGIDKGLTLLKNCGFQHICKYEKRKNILCEIESMA